MVAPALSYPATARLLYEERGRRLLETAGNLLLADAVHPDQMAELLEHVALDEESAALLLSCEAPLASGDLVQVCVTHQSIQKRRRRAEVRDKRQERVQAWFWRRRA